MTCSTTQVEISEPKPTKLDAWSCSSSDDLGESPVWIFGKNRCLSVGGGHKTPLSYRAC